MKKIVLYEYVAPFDIHLGSVNVHWPWNIDTQVLISIIYEKNTLKHIIVVKL